jgi:transcriptional regulator with XRE-family HTH domain
MSLNPAQNGPHVPSWTIADRLRKAREDAGLTQLELGEKISVSKRQIIYYEKGKKDPSRGHLLLWQMITGVPAEWIENGETPQGGGDDGLDGFGPGGTPRKITFRLPATANNHRFGENALRLLESAA